MVKKKGKVVSVNISQKTGEKKRNVGFCRLIKDFGLEGDAHAGCSLRQVSLLAVESIDKMRLKGLDVWPGDFAENITTQGLDLLLLGVGTKLGIGSSVVLEITQIGKECDEPCAIYYQAGDCVMPREGVFASVIEGGSVSVGDEISVTSTPNDSNM